MPTRFRCVADLSDKIIGRTITIPGQPPITGVLTSVFGIRDRVVLGLIVGSARMWTDQLDQNLKVEIHPLKDAPRVEIQETTP